VLPSPQHFEQVSHLVTRDSIRDSIAYGTNLDRHLDAFRPYAEAGIDVMHISQMAGRDRPPMPKAASSSTATTCYPGLREMKRPRFSAALMRVAALG
jgi:hypothetical protein